MSSIVAEFEAALSAGVSDASGQALVDVAAGNDTAGGCKLVDQAGFDGFAMSEHPYPDKQWLASGGHHAFDPFVSLSFAAAATAPLTVIAYLMVSGYRNPYLAGKAAGSMDILSGGVADTAAQHTSHTENARPVSRTEDESIDSSAAICGT
jgi:Luciferase-like monooxygenase